MMTIFNDDATLVAGTSVLSGKGALPSSFAGAPFLKPDNNWVALTRAQNFQIDAQGDEGTFYFECHFYDLDSGSFAFQRGVTTSVVRSGDIWLIKEWRTIPISLSI